LPESSTVVQVPLVVAFISVHVEPEPSSIPVHAPTAGVVISFHPVNIETGRASRVKDTPTGYTVLSIFICIEPKVNVEIVEVGITKDVPEIVELPRAEVAVTPGGVAVAVVIIDSSPRDKVKASPVTSIPIVASIDTEPKVVLSENPVSVVVEDTTRLSLGTKPIEEVKDSPVGILIICPVSEPKVSVIATPKGVAWFASPVIS